MTGQDGLRKEIAAALVGQNIWYVAVDTMAVDLADAALPVVQRHIDAAREQVAEQIAVALAAIPDEVYPEDVFGPVTTDETGLIASYLKELELPSLDRISANIMRHAYRMAARIAREHAKGDGDA